ncbi:hypothetical protein PRIPAC_81699 [Pristionchus pacificus]|uniref:Uncharacterized protein n=1 Tax=Pristionchus pacificus TaxID=54126 RepID=A0A2A6BXX3_PRIPA|nr:hypothetical protein PRIPAC_81699 [Pristionchus pacificus]|eukprot:PDM70755.1 hypothetical protein PRIPAC_44959 [Pristionchus pacificus]
MATVSTIMQTTGVRIATWSFSEAQSGKASADAQRMTFDQIRNRITTLLSQKKEHQRKEHGNRQRRYVKLIDDFERDLAEEGMSLDDIEEEVDLERPLDEDDLIITSDEIYDLVHSNMEFFDNPSEPVFSDFGEFEQ